tara:strand:- start:8707 stop:9693 length:987 start_codon:yes stop_codon:yes gene_type:complete
MRIREIKKNKPSKPRDPNYKAMQDLRSSGASGSHGDKTKEIPRKEKHKGKSYDINEKDPCWKGYKQIGMKKKGKKEVPNCVPETATPGATSAGNIATVANPHIANSKKKPKTQKPTDNALDNKSHGLFGQPLKRLNNSKETQMNSKDLIKENLADEASKVEQDHEVQMARAQLYKIAKYSIKLHEMLKNVSEQEGLEGWVQSKITKASDYIGAVYHNMDYEQKFEEVSESLTEKEGYCSDKCCGADVKEADCTCKPSCEHCDCNESVKETVTKELDYKESLADKLEAEKSEYVYEKQKGVDGKVCWKGYKRMGTKKKGGKTVDNCVKM